MVRLYNKSDYEEIRSWWKAYGGDLEEAVLPKLGFVAEVNETLAFSAFVFNDPSSRLGWIAFPCANPKIRRADRKKAIDEVLKTIKGFAELSNLSLVTYVHAGPFNDRLRAFGFVDGDPKPVSLIWRNYK